VLFTHEELMTYSLYGRSGYIDEETQAKVNFPEIDSRRREAVFSKYCCEINISLSTFQHTLRVCLWGQIPVLVVPSSNLLPWVATKI